MSLEKLKIFLLTFLFFSFFPLFAQTASRGDNVTVVTIEHARHTEYEKNKASGNEIIVLEGNVSIEVKKGNTKIKISSSTVRYDRKTSMLFAQGEVTLSQFSKDGKEEKKASADSLLFNTSTMEGIFDNSKIVQYGSSDSAISTGSVLVTSSSLMGSNDKGTMAFKHATITFCDDDNPHWKIRSSKAWMLPGGEFAFMNAVLFVGHIPVLYLPAFYYPKDELIFNPVIGFDKRRGYFVQTTTYLIGRKPLSVYGDAKDDGLFNLGRPSELKDQEREGIVLHNLDTNFTGSTDNYLKLLADYYTTLGGMVGLAGQYKSDTSYLKNVSGFFDMGWSNTVIYRNDVFSRYSMDKKIYNDYSDFLGLHLPFRFAGNFSLQTKEPFVFSLSVPFYSDPYFLVDFGTRKEYMDWIGLLTTSGAATDGQKNTDDSELKIASFSWEAGLNYKAKLPPSVNPYISNLSLSANSSILFDTMSRIDEDFLSRPSDYRQFSPERKKFYPSLVTPIRFSAQIGGTIYTFSSTPDSDKTAVKEGYDNGSVTKNEKIEKNGLFDFSDLPELSDIDIPSPVHFEGFNYSLGYTFSPRYITQNVYTSDSVNRDSSFEWSSKHSSYYEMTAPFSVNSSLTYASSFFSMKNTITFDPYYQHHPNLDGYKTDGQKDAVRLSDYNNKKIDLVNENTLSIRPFVYDPVFKNTGIDWSTSVKIVRTKFAGDADNPKWDYLTLNLNDDESITKNLVTGYVAATESSNLSQTLTLSSSLPPRQGEHDASLKLIFPHVEMNFATGVERNKDNDGNVTYTDKPLQQSLKINLFSDLNFVESFNYNLENAHKDSLKLAAEYKGLQAAFTMQYLYGYNFDKQKGWVSEDKERFQKYNMSLAYITPEMKFHYWKNRITFAPALETSVVYNFVKPTESYFTFIPSITFRINQFLDLTFSSESRNEVIFRYIEDYTDYGEIISGEKNILVDLMNSFAFWDTSLAKRKSSGFKIKNLKITANHNLHDWNFSSSFIFKPRLVSDASGRSKFSYEPYFSFLITWKPMGGVRTQIIDNYGEVELNP